MIEKYENIIYKVDDDLIEVLAKNFRQNVAALKKGRNKYVSVLGPFSGFDFVAFVHWFLEKNDELKDIQEEIFIDEKWLDSRFAHFAVAPDIVDEYGNTLVVRADFDFDERK